MSNSRSQSAEEVQRSAGGSVAGGVWFNHARYDSNGNVISGLAGLAGTYSYDVENRMVDNGVETYGYGAGNRRLWKKSTVSGSWAEVYLYGLRGEVLEVFRGMMGSPLERQSYTPTQRAWFGGRLIEKLGTAMNADRLGSYQGTYPYGELQGAVGTPGEKFGTYWRDATGLDYAVNRYYSSQMGRFLSADPYRASGGPAEPGSWNRYAYVEGDPVNFADPGGLQLRGPSCVPAYFAMPGGSIDTSTNCQAGYIEEWYMGGGGGGGGGFVATGPSRAEILSGRRAEQDAKALRLFGLNLARMLGERGRSAVVPKYMQVVADCWDDSNFSYTRHITYRLQDADHNPISYSNGVGLKIDETFSNVDGNSEVTRAPATWRLGKDAEFVDNVSPGVGNVWGNAFQYFTVSGTIFGGMRLFPQPLIILGLGAATTVNDLSVGKDYVYINGANYGRDPSRHCN